MQCLCFQETRNLKLHMNIILHQPKILDKIVRNSPINYMYVVERGGGVGWGGGWAGSLV